MAKIVYALFFGTLSMLPQQTITYTKHFEIGGQGEYMFAPTSTYTIVGASFLQSNVSSDTIIQCRTASGTDPVYINFAKDIPYFETNYVCENGSLWLHKTGNDEAFTLVNYLPYNRKISTNSEVIVYQTNTTPSTSTQTSTMAFTTSSVQYALYHNASALLWLLFLITLTASFLAVVNWYRKRF